MESNKQYKFSEHIRYEMSGEVQERVLIIPNIDGKPNMKKVLCLADTSLDIWKMLAEAKNYGQIVDEMSQKYQKEKREIESDVEGFLVTLLENGYIFDME